MNFKLLPAYLNMIVQIKSLTLNNQGVQLITEYLLVRFTPVKYSDRESIVIS